MPIQFILLGLTALYGMVACGIEDRSPPPGKRIMIHNSALHLFILEPVIPPTNSITIVLDHSLGGIEGYLIAEQLLQCEPQCERVCFYDRAGYGWSDHRFESRTSDHIVTELNALLTQANIKPPYLYSWGFVWELQHAAVRRSLS